MLVYQLRWGDPNKAQKAVVVVSAEVERSK
jgi:hypothetical protein